MRVVGASFEHGFALSCMFGRQVVPASFVNSSILACTTPSTSEGPVPVAVSHNGVDFTPAENEAPTFQFVKPFSVYELHPSFGPVEGGTRITVRGEGFEASSASSASGAACRFGTMSVPALVISDSELECSTPPSSSMNALGGGGLGPTAFAVSFNLRDFSQTVLQYRYVPRVLVVGVAPSVLVEGSSSRLRVVGDGFIESSLLRCLFQHNTGSESNAPASGNFSSPARFVSRQEVTCDAPAVSQGYLSVDVTNNGRGNIGTAGAARSVVVVAQMTLASSPAAGSVFGGTRVQLRVSGFPAALDTHAYCKFGPVRVAALALQREPLGVGSVTNDPRRSSNPAYVIECIAPAGSAPGVVDLLAFAGVGSAAGSNSDLGSNETAFGKSTFEYTQEPVLAQVSDTVVYAGVEGPALRVSGQNLFPEELVLEASARRKFSVESDSQLTRSIRGIVVQGLEVRGLVPRCRFRSVAWTTLFDDAVPSAPAEVINETAVACTVPSGL